MSSLKKNTVFEDLKNAIKKFDKAIKWKWKVKRVNIPDAVNIVVSSGHVVEVPKDRELNFADRMNDDQYIARLKFQEFVSKFKCANEEWVKLIDIDKIPINELGEHLVK